VGVKESWAIGPGFGISPHSDEDPRKREGVSSREMGEWCGRAGARFVLGEWL